MLSQILLMAATLGVATPETDLNAFRGIYIAEAQRITNSVTLVFLELNLPDRGYPSGRRRGAASRGCSKEYLALQALVPNTNFGLTSSENPNFWFYIPKVKAQSLVGEFVLQEVSNREGSNNEIYREQFSLSSQDKIVKIYPQLSTQGNLKHKKTYQWFFKIYCRSQNMEELSDYDPSDYVYTEGQIEKITLPPNIETQISTGSLSDRLNIYAEYGIWYDLVSTLGEQLLAEPNNDELQQEWNELLSAVGLDNLSDKELIELSIPNR